MTHTDRRRFLRTGAAFSAAALLPDLALPAAPRLGEPLSIGLIGAGRQGRAILAELAKFPDVKVAALCDVSAARLASGLRRAEGAQGLADHRALLDLPEIEAVVVATPSHLHREPALAAIAAGKHVYCEGPLATTESDAAAIAAAARAASTIFQTGMQARSNPIYLLARSFVASGAIRDVVSMRAQHHRKSSWRLPAADPAEEAALNWQLDGSVSLGLVGEFGVHQLDAVHWFLGSYPSSVSGSGAVLCYPDGRSVADTVHASFDFGRGRVLAYAATLGSSAEGTHELFTGTMGTVKLGWTAGWMFKEADAPTQGWEVYANRQGFGNEQGITLIADATKLAAQNKLKEGVGLPEPPLYFALADFLRSIREAKPVACSAEEGLRAATVAIAAHRAISSGERIAIEVPGSRAR